MPSHTRYGPFMVGGVVACSLLLGQDDAKNNKNKPSSSMLSTVFAWVFTCMAIGQLSVPLMPAPPPGMCLYCSYALVYIIVVIIVSIFTLYDMCECGLISFSLLY